MILECRLQVNTWMPEIEPLTGVLAVDPRSEYPSHAGSGQAHRSERRSRIDLVMDALADDDLSNGFIQLSAPWLLSLRPHARAIEFADSPRHLSTQNEYGVNESAWRYQAIDTEKLLKTWRSAVGSDLPSCGRPETSETRDRFLFEPYEPDDPPPPNPPGAPPGGGGGGRSGGRQGAPQVASGR